MDHVVLNLRLRRVTEKGNSLFFGLTLQDLLVLELGGSRAYRVVLRTQI